MAGSSPLGPSRPPLRVRYYPRRVARPPVAEPLSPGQALHLIDDPARAALAEHTADEEVFVAVERSPAPTPVAAVAPPVPPAPRASVWRRVWRRLTQSN